MAVIGLLLALAALAFGADVVYENLDRYNDVSIASTSMGHVSIGRLFGAGFLAGLAFVLFLALAASALGRRRRVRAARRSAAAEERDRADALRAENERLGRELEQQRAAGANEATGYPATTAGAPAYPGEAAAAPAYPSETTSVWGNRVDTPSTVGPEDS